VLSLLLLCSGQAALLLLYHFPRIHTTATTLI
jgi:hypothetical protein